MINNEHICFNRNFRWSYGILLFELFSLGEVPFASQEQIELLNYIERSARLAKPEFCPDEM